jgi:outer membrane lipoprotein-sorting protein
MKVAISLGVVPSIMIKRPDGVYVYNPVSQNYTKTNATFSEISLEEQSHALLTNVSFIEVGNETINGNATTIIQYTTNGPGNSGTVKVWIWNEKGIPIKSEISMVKGSTTLMTKTEYVHFVFGDIPLSEFSV